MEVAPALREGGYVIDSCGAGFEVEAKMEIIPDLEKADFNISRLLLQMKITREKAD